jgi:hypothetical protein
MHVVLDLHVGLEVESVLSGGILPALLGKTRLATDPPDSIA